jgi:hypothetical protein
LLSPFAPEVSQPRIRREHSEAVQLAAGARLFNQTDATDSICFIEPGKLLVRLEPPGAERTALHQIKTRDRLIPTSLDQQTVIARSAAKKQSSWIATARFEHLAITNV